MSPQQVHQIVPYLAYGDAVGNQTLEIKRLLREWGYTSEIFAEHWDPRLEHECRPYREYAGVSRPENLLLLQFCIGGEVNRYVLTLPDRVAIYYHNVTPAHFFYRVNAFMALQCDEARRDLQRLAGRVPAIAASPFNAQELKDLGFKVLGIAPYVVNFEKLDAGLKSEGALEIGVKFAAPGVTTWLYVGRLAPNKCIEDVIKTFYFYRAWIHPASRLLLVGTGAGAETYVERLVHLVHRLDLESSVIFAGHYGAAEGLAAFYEMADLYISMSEHEGFCIPLLEAMYYRLPVLAFGSSGVPFTLGDTGVLVRSKDHAFIAEVAGEIIANPELRGRLIRRQRDRLAAFAPDLAREDFRRCLDAALEGMPERAPLQGEPAPLVGPE